MKIMMLIAGPCVLKELLQHGSTVQQSNLRSALPTSAHLMRPNRQVARAVFIMGNVVTQ